MLAFPDFVDVDHTLDARSAHPPARLGPLKKDMEGVMMKTYVAALAATATLLLASVSLDASASVTYTWYPINEKAPYIPADGSCGFVFDCTDRLEVTDEAFSSGSMSYSFDHTYPGALDPGAPLIELDSIGHALRPSDDESDWVWYLDTDVRFGDYLTGDLNINDGENSYSMSTSGDSKLWTISGFLSDDWAWGCYDHPCSGALGYWSSIGEVPPRPVPEPDPFAAFGFLAFGLLGADAARRWRRARRERSEAPA
ncbi:MAG TPA: hypothetical protein VFK29_10460 [Rhodanobacteraceae bacterium]|nr:hypothetical protein [Rhodanobacteraceae bacterium]